MVFWYALILLKYFCYKYFCYKYFSKSLHLKQEIPRLNSKHCIFYFNYFILRWNHLTILNQLPLDTNNWVYSWQKAQFLTAVPRFTIIIDYPLKKYKLHNETFGILSRIKSKYNFNVDRFGRNNFNSYLLLLVLF